jgi:Ferrochelatase
MSAAPSQPTPAAPSDEEHSASLHRQRAVLLLRVESGVSAVEAEAAAAHASALEASLPEGWAVFSAIHHGEPNVATALESIEDAGCEDLVVVCDHPYFSRHTTRTALSDLYRMLSHLRTPLNVTVRAEWYDDIAFVNAQAALLAKHAADHGLSPADTYLSFWARRPMGSPGDGSDPYYAQVRRSAELVAERLGWPTRMVSLRFLENDATAERLTFRKVTGRAVLACPLSALLEREQLVRAVCGSSDPTLSVPRDSI